MGFLDFGGNEKTRGHVETMIGAGTSVAGEISSRSSLRIDGKIKGIISSDEEVYIGEPAKIEGNIKGKRVVVAGEVRGDVSASDSIEIKKNGRIYGDISGNKLSVEDGASYKGRVTMGQPGEEQKSRRAGEREIIDIREQGNRVRGEGLRVKEEPVSLFQSIILEDCQIKENEKTGEVEVSDEIKDIIGL